jgi:O-antigen ligase
MYVKIDKGRMKVNRLSMRVSPIRANFRIHPLDWLLLSMVFTPLYIPIAGKLLKFYLSDLVVLFLSLKLLADFANNCSLRFRIHKVVKWMFAYSLLILFSLTFTVNLVFSIINAKLFIMPLLVFLIAYNTLRTSEDINHLAIIMGVLGLYFGITALYNWQQFFSGSAVLGLDLEGSDLEIKDMIQTVTGRSNTVAGINALLLPIELYLIINGRRLFKLLGLLSILILVTTIIFAMSRAAMVALFAGLLVFFFLEIRSEPLRILLKRATVGIMIFFLAIGMAWQFLPSELQTLFLARLDQTKEIVSYDMQADSRWATWSTAIINNSFPLVGIGIGNFTSFMTKLNPDIAKSPHNLYVEIFVEIGLLGLFCLLAILFRCGLVLWRLTSITGQNHFNGLATSLAMSYTVFIVNVFFEPNYYSPTFAYLFFILMAMGCFLHNHNFPNKIFKKRWFC